MSQKGTRTNLLPAAGLVVVLTLIAAFDWATHLDLIAIIATIAVCAGVIVRWVWRARYS